MTSDRHLNNQNYKRGACPAIGASNKKPKFAMTVQQPSESPALPDPPPKKHKKKKRKKKGSPSVERTQSTDDDNKPPDVKLNEISKKGPTSNSNWTTFTVLQGKPPPNPSPKIGSFPKREPRKTNTWKNRQDVVAIDCEMVGIGYQGKDNMLARVSLVNDRGDCIYDTFVKPREDVVDYRTYVSGVRPEDMKQGKDFEIVQAEVAALLKDKILVGHSIKGDLHVLYLSHPRKLIRDTSKYFKLKGKGTPSLKKLAMEYLKVTIQEGEHSSVQDAQAAVHLYNMYKYHWEKGGGNRPDNRVPQPKNTQHQSNIKSSL